MSPRGCASGYSDCKLTPSEQSPSSGLTALCQGSIGCGGGGAGHALALIVGGPADAPRGACGGLGEGEGPGPVHIHGVHTAALAEGHTGGGVAGRVGELAAVLAGELGAVLARGGGGGVQGAKACGAPCKCSGTSRGRGKGARA